MTRTQDTPHCILICGDREWTDIRIIRQILLVLRDPWDRSQRLVHGDARGADTIASEVGLALGYYVMPYPADWTGLGPSAGPRRNAQMLREEGVEIVYGFHDDIRKSKGTKDMLKRAKKDRIPNYLISHP